MKVWTNGCFDVLHRGHLELFKFCKDRMEMLNSLIYVDKVIPFRSKTELERLVKWIHPSVMVIGSDWKDKEVIGKKWTDRLMFFNRVGDYSTTNILGKK